MIGNAVLKVGAQHTGQLRNCNVKALGQSKRKLVILYNNIVLGLMAIVFCQYRTDGSSSGIFLRGSRVCELSNKGMVLA